MISAWKQVAEDFAPFDVNVTTVRSSYTAAAAGRRMRLVMTKTAWEPSSNVGFAAIGSFPNAGGYWSERNRMITSAGEDIHVPTMNGESPIPSGYGATGTAIAYPSDIVCWVFIDGFRPLETSTVKQTRLSARQMTHELGHTFGLLHDDLLTTGGVHTSYYGGHGSGDDRWSPHMGGNYEVLAQWSKGEYADAYNRGWGTLPNSTTRALQDDLAIIGAGVSGGAGNGLLADDKGDTFATSALLTIDNKGMVSNEGLIHTGTDLDVYRIPIVASSSVIDLFVRAHGADTNLDLYAELQNSSGTSLAVSVPLQDRNAKIGPITVNAAGNYYLIISGSSLGTGSTGWTRYGSLGNYVVFGSVTGTGGAPVINASSLPPDASVGISYNFPLDATNNPTSYYLVSGTVPPGLGFSGGSLAGIPTAAGEYSFTLAAANAQGGSSKFFTMYVFGPASLDDALDSSPIVWTTTSPPSNAAANLWQGQRAFSFDGSDAARSGAIGANSESILSTTLKGPGKLTFYWRTSSHSSDRLIFKLNTTESPSISGETAWAQQTVLIPQGTWPVSWIYRTDAGTTAGQNAGFVDRVKYLANPDFPAGNFYAGGRVGAGFLRQIPLVNAGVPTTWALTGGALPPGITLDPNTGNLSGVPNTVGTYDPEITAANDAGSSTTSPRIYIYPDVSLPTGLDAEGLVWVTDPVNPWFGDNTNTHDGTDVAHSGPIRHSLSSFMQTTVTGPGTFSFWWKASTEATDDPVYFSIDGVVQSTISGETAWAQQSYTLGSGAHTLRWNYVRDGSGNGISNMVWVDQVSWITPGPSITNALSVNWTVGGVYSIPLTSDDPNATWSVTGTVPSDFYFGNLDKLVLGIPKLPRVVTFTLNATNAAGTTTSRLFTANIESSYTAWARTKGLAVGTPLGDPDKDGILNIAELAFGFEPNVPNHGFQPVSFDPVQRRMRAIFNRRTQNHYDLKYEVQFSTDLQTWTSVAYVNNGELFTNISAISISEVQVSPAPNQLSQVTVIASNQPSATSRKYYMRVKVTQL